MSTAADTAHGLRELVRKYLAEERQGWVPLAAALHTLHEHEAWRELGSDSFSDWMAQEDIGRSRGYLLVSVWATFVVGAGMVATELTGTELSKYVLVLGPVRRGDVAPEDALADVRELSRSDLRAKYGTTEEPEEVELCPTCGQPMPSAT